MARDGTISNLNMKVTVKKFTCDAVCIICFNDGWN